MSTGREHPHIPRLKQQLVDGEIGRREFLRFATLLGMAAPAAYAFAGTVTGEGFVPQARAEDMPKGGLLRVAMRVHEVTHPHAHNWSPPATITRQVCDTLTRTGQDNITRPHLLESWEASDDLKTWTLKLRDNVKWHSGRPVTADDILWNFDHILWIPRPARPRSAS